MQELVIYIHQEQTWITSPSNKGALISYNQMNQFTVFETFSPCLLELYCARQKFGMEFIVVVWQIVKIHQIRYSQLF